ncbi:MAG: hypothetical protein HFI29_05205 [Lachnospiraceae bacterium]|nr:hypothetical protein [Lachnospiraceae bacterium]
MKYLLEAGEWWYNERNQRDLYPDIPVYEDVVYYACAPAARLSCYKN